MKYLTILLVLFNLTAKGQETTYMTVGLLSSVRGVYATPAIEKTFREPTYALRVRVGYAAHPIEFADYVYFQNGFGKKVGNVELWVYPVWLRAYNKSIGYQTPSSVMMAYSTNIKVRVELSVEYWNRSVFPSIGIIYKLTKIDI